MTVSYLTRKVCLIALLIAFILIIPTSASVTLSGVKYMANVNPGETVTFPMTLSIPATDPASDYELTVLGFGNSDDGSYVGVNPAQDTTSQSARPYITLDKPVIHLEPGKSDIVTASISVPNGKTGGLYALINIHPKVSISSDAGTKVVTAINVPIMITLTGTPITETGIINAVTIDNTVSPALVTTTFTNTGNHHYYGAQNKIVITNAAGGEIGTFATKPLVTTIVPGGTVNFTQTINIPLTSDIYTVKSNVVTDVGRDLDVKINQFTATGNNNITQTSNPEETTTPFSMWNIALLLIVIGVVGIIIGFILLRRSG